MAIDFLWTPKVYGAAKIALKNPFISAQFDRILKHIESNWALCYGWYVVFMVSWVVKFLTQAYEISDILLYSYASSLEIL